MFSTACFSPHCHHNVTDLHIHDLAAAAGTADPEPLLTWTLLVFYCPLAVVLGIVPRPIYQQVQTLDGANSPFDNLCSLLTFFCTTFLPIKLNDRNLNQMYWFALSEIIQNNDHCPAPTVADQGGSLLTVSLLVMKSQVSLYKQTCFCECLHQTCAYFPLWLSLELRLSVVVHFDNAGWRSFPFSSHCDIKGCEGEVSLTCQQQQNSVWLCFVLSRHDTSAGVKWFITILLQYSNIKT